MNIWSCTPDKRLMQELLRHVFTNNRDIFLEKTINIVLKKNEMEHYLDLTV